MARFPHHVQLNSGISQGNANGNADFLSPLPLPATERNHSGPSSPTPSNEERFFLIRSHGLLLGRPSAVRVGFFVGWCPQIRALARVGSRSLLAIFAILANTVPE